MTPEEVQAQIGVSRETLDKLRLYAETLEKWQPKINLVGPATLPDLWRRHILDSAQLYQLLPEGTETLADLGSGAGFPGLVLAVMGVPDVHLLESDARKCAFLREVARLTDTKVTIHNKRIEQVQGLQADCITARALAPVADLLKLAQSLFKDDTECLFLKGRNSEEELTQAAKDWKMTVQRIPSVTDPSGLILRLKEVSRA
ncbi:16S rRNA (guanine(527)-N(7))-methyltransferase RsmG [Telmatospirillum sp. J64-1]|uniref:16S rRNA (guanine(527)-N(7))-methyltransferase RsmG n=1 Tax=Telmatospirillum sp. J64-1 TaxID=2502183 RepID=UPI00115E011A|nr:16S rRNA (guanine(527)-N(7))-methyltransferase RsmG [Telmatospirillum sp. J64-1]